MDIISIDEVAESPSEAIAVGVPLTFWQLTISDFSLPASTLNRHP